VLLVVSLSVSLSLTLSHSHSGNSATCVGSSQDLMDVYKVTITADDTLCCYGHSAQAINDGGLGYSDADHWHSSYSSSNHWLMVAWPAGIAVAPAGYSLISRQGLWPQYPITAWEMQGSNDGVTWTTLDVVDSSAGVSTTKWVTRSVGASEYYAYVRWWIPGVGAARYVEIAEVTV
jgi:hypothetical protein